MIPTLVVDDDAMVGDVHRAYVERVPGFAVVGVAHRGVEAVERVRSGAVELVLLDLYLPDMHGLELCRVLRAASPRPLDIIAVTAARDAETVRRAVTEGVVQYLVKPFGFAALRDKLERYAAYRHGLERRTDTDQHGVDELFGALRGSTATPLPKGLSRPTYELLAERLRDAARDVSAAELADGAGLSRVTARRYLERLVDEGLAELHPRYGSGGRPEHRYRWTGR